MRNERFKQVACISEKSPQAFEKKMNNILAGIANPEIIIDTAREYTAYVIYSVRKEVPETLIELLELLDEDGGGSCEQCPYFKRKKDKRMKRHDCTAKGIWVRANERACEVYYKDKMQRAGEMQRAEEMIEQYKNIPYTIE